MPFISVIIPVYNASNTIRRTLRSVLAQTFTSFEVLCIDDCSNDDSVRIMQEFKDSRLSVIDCKINRGAWYCRNLGLDMAQGEYVAFLDSDDYWNENHFQEFVRKCNGRPHNNLIYTTAYTYGDSVFYPDVNKLNPDKIFEGCHLSCLTTIHSKSDIRFRELMREDLDYWFRLLKRTEGDMSLVVGRYVGGHYEIHDLASSNNKWKMLLGQWQVYRVNGLGIMRSLFHLLGWIYNGVRKYS